MRITTRLKRELHRVAGVVAVLALVGSTAACGDEAVGTGTAGAAAAGETRATTTVNIVAHDFGFTTESPTIPAGPIETVLTNEGEQPHQALIYRLNDGVSFEDFKKRVMADDSLVPQLAVGTDGVSEVIGTGKEIRATGDVLEAGRYAIVCFVRDQSLKTTKNHAELGMIGPLTVE